MTKAITWKVLVFPLKNTVPIICSDDVVEEVKSMFLASHESEPSSEKLMEDCWLNPGTPSFASKANQITVVAEDLIAYNFKMKVESYTGVMKCFDRKKLTGESICMIPFSTYLLCVPEDIAEALENKLIDSGAELLLQEREVLSTITKKDIMSTVISTLVTPEA